MYDHTKQYRCDIIRGKSQNEMDDLLPAYAKVVDEICPCKHDDFENLFNNSFVRFIPANDMIQANDRVKKTLANHRTEISGKLFGMYYFAGDGMVYESERTLKFLQDNDQPSFFKDICFKMQFPNGMQKTKSTVMTRIRDKICIRPLAYVIKLLQVAAATNVVITRKILAYYVLNSLDVLQGNATPEEVLKVIDNDRRNGLIREIHSYDDYGEEKAYSFRYQHINEQLNLLELANLIRMIDYRSDRSDKLVLLNPMEKETIEIFASTWDRKPEFNVYSYDLGTTENRNIFQREWDAYYSKLSPYATQFSTSIDAIEFTGEKEVPSPNLVAPIQIKHSPSNKVEFGDEGEELVYEYEKNRVLAYNHRLVNKVLALGKTRGLGYDIQSVIAEPGHMEEYVKYIEVKSTKRLTCPNIDDPLWVDTLNITRNELIAAKQHGIFYSIYRVYFTRNGISMYVINNVADKLNDGRILATPMTYRIDFSNNSVDNVIPLNLNFPRN